MIILKEDIRSLEKEFWIAYFSEGGVRYQGGTPYDLISEEPRFEKLKQILDSDLGSELSYIMQEVHEYTLQQEKEIELFYDKKKKEFNLATYEKIENAAKILTVENDVRINKEIILEKGDKIKVISEGYDLFNAIENKMNDLGFGIVDDELVTIVLDWFGANYKNRIKAIDIDIMSNDNFERYLYDIYQDFLATNNQNARLLGDWFN